MLDKSERKRRERNESAFVEATSNPFEYLYRSEKMRARNPLNDYALSYKGFRTTLMAYSVTEAVEAFSSLLYPWLNVDRNRVEVNSIGKVEK